MTVLEEWAPMDSEQIRLPFDGDARVGSDRDAGNARLDIGVTFKDSLKQGAFGWYPYVEGFSATYIQGVIEKHRPANVYDPFGGSGTVCLAAAKAALPSFYSEINPFMAFVTEAKVNGLIWAQNNPDKFMMACAEYSARLYSCEFEKQVHNVDLIEYRRAFPERDFFEDIHVRELICARNLAHTYTDISPQLRDFFLLACASNAVRASNMTRRADLRRRRSDEYKNRIVDVRSFVTDSVTRFRRDVQNTLCELRPTSKVSDDAKHIPDEFEDSFDFALTSPPYLNGTNYFRNTKIELWLLGYIASERELSSFTRRAVTSGINNVSKAKPDDIKFPFVEPIVRMLEEVAGDSRIPLLVRHYFSDMHRVFGQIMKVLVPGAKFVLDIGDSKFYGVHVPTDQLLINVAREAGLALDHEVIIARRYSRDKSELKQVEITFSKPGSAPRKTISRETTDIQLLSSATAFHQALPFRDNPFCKKTWGHRLHSLCSYQGKLKPAMAHWLVREFVPTKGRLLDPLGGVGTIPFEAAIQGRFAISNDKSPFPAMVAAAKLAPPSFSAGIEAWDNLWGQALAIPESELDMPSAGFGLNGQVRDFYHPATLRDILRCRSVFLMSHQPTPEEKFAWAALLHVLHGNRPYALSRTSHPITPFHPSGPFVYKSVYEKVRDRITSALKNPLPEIFLPGIGLYGDFRDLSVDRIGKFDAIITSPPFLGMRFDRPNWLRLWFCGWQENDFHERSLGFLERQQTKSSECYIDFFDHASTLLKSSGVLIIHIGSTEGKGRRLDEDIARLAQDRFRSVYELRENVQDLEQHGIKDKGLTKHHHLMFFVPR